MGAIEDELFTYSEYIQDVTGWKAIIFLPFNFIWQLVVMFSVVTVYIIITNRVTYHVATSFHIYVGYTCDALYLVDVLCCLLHRILPDTSKLRTFKPWPWACLLLDSLSLIPMELIYGNIYISGHTISESVWEFMYFNRTIRVYRLYMYFKKNNAWTHNFDLYFIFNVMELLIYALICQHTCACIYQSIKTDADLESCPSQKSSCIVLNEMNIYFLMTLRFIGDSTLYNTAPKRLACCIFMTIGYLYIYGFMIPSFILSCVKRLRKVFELWSRYERLKMFVNNLTDNDDLKKRTLMECRTVWNYGKGDDEPALLKSFPLSLRKNVYSDLYWEAMRHSELLQSISYGCKRSLALNMIGDFYLPGSIFWYNGEMKNCLLYLSSGNLQIMAEENSQSPIVSFSGGTILGESSIFLANKSKAILRVATFSEIHVLHARDLFRVLKSYPADRHIILRKLHIRLEIAKMTQIRKREIYSEFFGHGKSLYDENFEDDAVKWIKTQYREVMLLNNVQVKSQGEQRSTASKLKAVIHHTSAYLPLLSLSDDVEVHTDLMCLKTSLPWVIDPGSQFMQFWTAIVLFFVCSSALIYPVFIAWWRDLEPTFFNVSLFVSLIFLVDLFMLVSTAVKTKGGLLVKWRAIVLHRLKSVSFYADCVAAFPFQLLVRIVSGGKESYVKISYSMSLVKIYKMAKFLNEWAPRLNGHLSIRVMIKYLFIYCISVYWIAAFMKVCDVDCLIYKCLSVSWYDSSKESNYPNYRNEAPIFFTMSIAMDVPDSTEHLHNHLSAILIMSCAFISEIIILCWFGDFSAARIFETSHEIQFNRLLKSVSNFMNERHILGRIKKRIMENLAFQWHYDKGDYLTQERSMLEDASLKLRAELNAPIFHVIKSCDLFVSEDEDFIWDLCRRCTRLPLPANSGVVTFGVQSTSLYIVYKGYLQLNSFLLEDTKDGVASSIVYGPGNILPLVIAFNQLPSAISARTLTDCELIVLSLEELLTTMSLHYVLKDTVDVIKSTSLKPLAEAQLTLTKVINSSVTRKENENFHYKKLKWLASIVKLIPMDRTVNSRGSRYHRWEIFCILNVLIQAFFWPIIFAEHSRIQLKTIIIYCLLALDSLTWIDFYIKFHLSYCNKKGIYVTHPTMTARHYLMTSFWLDLFFFLPHFHSLYLIISNPSFAVTDETAAFHSVMRILNLYRFVRYLIYNENLTNTVIYFKFIGFLLLLFLATHCAISLRMRSEIHWRENSNGDMAWVATPDGWVTSINIPTADTPPEFYWIVFYCMVNLICRSYPVFRDESTRTLITKISTSLLGIILKISIFGFYISREAGSNNIFTTYQHQMKSLIHYLKNEGAEDTITASVVQHFEHEWAKKKGKDLHKIFSRFPRILEEDLLYPIYRTTLIGVPCFTQANDGFFRELTRYFTEVHFCKDSTIIFPYEVDNTIYFIHNGQCLVTTANVVLVSGSMMGDIKGQGKMTSNIIARTHVVLLSIPSPIFFLILNNFYQTEDAFYNAIDGLQDFVASGYELKSFADKTEEVGTSVAKKELQESEFVMPDEADIATTQTRTDGFRPNLKPTFWRKLNPNSMTRRIFNILFILDATVTVLFVPLVIGLRLMTPAVFLFIYFLDLIWIFKIVISLNTVYIEPDTGIAVQDFKVIMKNYAKKIDGLISDILSLLPLEIVYGVVDYFFKDWNKPLLKYCFLLRLIRFLTLWVKVTTHKKTLSLSEWKRWLIIIGQQLITYNLFTAIYLLLATDKEIRVEDYEKEFSQRVQEALLWSYLFVGNLYTGTGIYIFPPKDLSQITFMIIVAMYSTIQRNIFVAEVLSIMNVTFFVKSEEISKIQNMDKYLGVRDASPALKQKLISYAGDLLEHYKAQVMPTFLQVSPYYIRVQIMNDLYVHHLVHCYPFQGLDINFLKQLAARLERHIYLPGDIIVEREDVDGNMFFVHKGEVSRIESHELYPALFYETQVYIKDEYFELEQGLEGSVPHSFTYRAKTLVDLLHLNYNRWSDLRSAFPEVNEIINLRLHNLRATAH